MFWKLIAWAAVRARGRIFLRAQRTPYTDIIGQDGHVYMRRWWLFNPYPGHGGEPLRSYRWLPSIRVHHILRPDEDRHLHNHPWAWRTIILSGRYVEEDDRGVFRMRREGGTASLTPDRYHRIAEVDHVEGALTLFITFRKVGSWGFRVNRTHVPWQDYLWAKELNRKAKGG